MWFECGWMCVVDSSGAMGIGNACCCVDDDDVCVAMMAAYDSAIVT